MKKRILAMLLCIAMVLSLVPVTALATEIQEPSEVLAAEETAETVEETTAAAEESEAAEETEAAEEPEAAEETEAAEEPAAEETVPQETEAVTVETIEVAGGEEAVKNSVYQDEEGGYRFETFEDLQQLVAQWREYGHVVYAGQGDLVITQDITIPEGMDCYVRSGSKLIIPEGVTLTNDGFLMGDDIVVNGTLVANAQITLVETLVINGQILNGDKIYLNQSVELIGAENISFTTDHAFVERVVLCHTKAEFLAVVANQGSQGSHWNYAIDFFPEENIVLDQDVYIFNDTQLYCYSRDYTITIAEGATFHVDSYNFNMNIDFVVKGTFKHEKGSIQMYTGDGTITFVDNGKYTGSGEINIYNFEGDGHYTDVIKGLDMSQFVITDEGYCWILRDASNLTRLAEPTDLTWHKEYRWSDNGQKLVDYMGAIAFKPAQPSAGDYQIRYWVERDGEFVICDYDGVGYGVDYEAPQWLSSGSFAMRSPESGKYKFSVQAVCWDGDAQYANSKEVFSDVFNYVKPAAQLSAPVPKTLEIVNNNLMATWDGAGDQFFIEWHYAPTLEEVGRDDDAYSLYNWGEYQENCDYLGEWALQEYGTGYYYFRIRALSDDITKVCNSQWSDYSEPYYYFNAVSNVKNALSAAVETSNSADDIRKAVQAIDAKALVEALQKDEYGQILDLFQWAEDIAGGPVGVQIDSGFTGMTRGQVSVIGANLNNGSNITLAIGNAAKSHTLTGDLKHPAALSFSMKLANVGEQKVPVVVTLPVPAGIVPSGAVLVHHTASGDEILKPISYSKEFIQVVVNGSGDFTITQKTFSQADFEAEVKAAVDAGEYEYVLKQAVVLTKNLNLKTNNFSLVISEGGALTIPKGITFITDAYILVDEAGAELNVEGTLEVNYVEVYRGTATIAKGATLKPLYENVGLYLHEDAKLIGWDKAKTSAVAEVTTLAEVESLFAQADQYYYMNVYVVGDVAVKKNLTVPNNAMLAPNYGSVSLDPGVTLTINGEVDVFWGGILDVQKGAKVVNNNYFSCYGGTINMDGTYTGTGRFVLGPKYEINGNLIHITYEYPGDNTMKLTANLLPEDPNAKFVWEILDGKEYTKLDVKGNVAIASDRVEITEQHEVTIKVSTKDGKVSNTFVIWAVPNEDLGGDAPDHMHVYEEVERVEPTYTENGYVIYVCECGETKEEVLKAQGLSKPVVTVDNDETSGAPYLTWTHEGAADGYKVYRATSKTGTYKVIDTVEEAVYVDTTVTAGKTYYYKIEAVCAADSKLNSKSDAATAYAKCATPNATVTYNRASGKNVFAWEKVPGAAKYEIYRTSIEDMTHTLVATTTKLTPEDVTAEVGKTYTYTFRAVASKSNYSGVEGGAMETFAICAQPDVKISLDKETGKPFLSWKAVDGAVSYRIYKMNEANEPVLVSEQTELTYLDAEVGAGVKCSYKVQAVADDFRYDSFLDNEVSIYSAIGTPVMTAETDVATGKPKLTWTTVAGATAYKVYRSTSATKSYKVIAEVETLEYLDESAAVGKTFYYKVLAVVGDTTSEFSNYEKLTAKCAQPEIRVITGFATGKPGISWEKITGAKKYEIYRATERDGTYKKIATITGTYYQDSKAVVGTDSYYKVVAVGSKAAYNSVESDFGWDKVICAQPVVTATTDAATGKPSLSWKAVEGAKNYWIGRQLPGEDGMTEIATVTDLKFVDLAVSADTEVKYSVAALSEVAGYNSWESWVTVRSTIASPAVTFAVDAVSGKPVLNWDAVEGAVEYQIYRSSSATKSYKVIATVEDLEYLDTSVSAGKGYYYKVMAIGENCQSAYSAYARIYANCAQPEVELTTNAKNQPVLTWAKVTGAKKYEVYRATEENGTYKKLTSISKTTYTDTKAAKDVTYYYQVKAIPSSSKYASASSIPVARFPGEYELWSTGRWYTEGLSSDGGELEKFCFELDKGMVNVFVSYFHRMEMEVTQEDLDFYNANGFLVDDHGNYCYDITLYNGNYYASAMFGGWDEGNYVENGDTVTMTLVNGYWEEGDGEDDVTYHNGATVVLKKNNDGTCTVKSVEGAVVDALVTEILLANPVLKKLSN